MDIKNKTCLLLGLGRSLEELDKRILEFKDANVVWCGMSSFDVPQKYILDRINKHFSIVFDCSTVQNAVEYELTRRIPRIVHHLEAYKDSIYMTTNSDKNNTTDLRNRIAPEFSTQYRKQIIYVEELGINPNPFCVSIHLFIASLYKMGCKEVILFGQDGDSSGTYDNRVESYYKSDLIKEDKIIAGNLVYNLVGDTNNVNSSYAYLLMDALHYIPTPKNCSPRSSFTVFKTVTYDDTIQYLKNV